MKAQLAAVLLFAVVSPICFAAGFDPQAYSFDNVAARDSHLRAPSTDDDGNPGQLDRWPDGVRDYDQLPADEDDTDRPDEDRIL